MIICKVCSARNEDEEEFCRVCGKYLPWHGDKVVALQAEEPQETDTTEELPEEPKLGFWKRVKIALHISKKQATSKETDPKISDASDQDSTDNGDKSKTVGEKSKQFAGYVRKKATAIVYEDLSNSMAGQVVTIVSDRKKNADEQKIAASKDQDTPEAIVSPTDSEGTTQISIGQPPVEQDDNTEIPSDEERPEKLSAQVIESTSVLPIDVLAEPMTTAALPVTSPGMVTTSRKPGEPVKPDSVLPSVAVTAQYSVTPKSTALRKPDEIIQSQHKQKSRDIQIGVSEEIPSPDDIYCAKCNQFNPPTREFCRRCGNELHAPTGNNAVITYQPLTWWQRHWHPDVKLVPAGERPGKWGKIVSGAGSQGRVWRIAGRTLLGALAIVLLVSLVGPFAPSMQNWFLSVYHNTENRVNVTYTQVFAMGSNATSSNPSHPPAYAVDDADNTWWQSANYPKKSKFPGVGARITALFSEKETVNKIGWLGGVAGTPQAYLSEARPREIRLTFYPGGYHVIEYLKDTQSFQQFSINAVNITSMVCTILKVYPSATGHAVAITEIEFFQRM